MTATSLPLDTVLEIRDQCLCFAAQRAARRLARRFDRVFAPFGLTNGQFSILVALNSPWGPRLGELAEFLAMDSTTMTAAIKPLERRALLKLEPDPKDRRARRPILTDAGRALAKAAAPVWRAEHRKLQAELGQDDPLALPALLARIGAGDPR